MSVAFWRAGDRLRHRLFYTASAGVLLGALAAGGVAFAAPAPAPSTQLDFIGQWSTVSGAGVAWADGGRPLRSNQSFDGEFDLAVTPAASEWVYSGSIRYGRSNPARSSFAFPSTTGTSSYTGKGREDEEHYMLDFQVGHEVGLGQLPTGATSVLSGGVKFADFKSKTAANFTTGSKYTNHRSIQRSTFAFGPVLSWRGSVPINNGPFSVRAGASIAALFGEARVKEMENGTGFLGLPFSDAFSRNTSVVVANPGGYLALRWQAPASPYSLSVGYRADDYIGILDTGGDTRHRGDRLLAGPFFDFGVVLP
jgi:hypothetical protein